MRQGLVRPFAAPPLAPAFFLPLFAGMLLAAVGVCPWLCGVLEGECPGRQLRGQRVGGSQGEIHRDLGRLGALQLAGSDSLARACFAPLALAPTLLLVLLVLPFGRDDPLASLRFQGKGDGYRLRLHCCRGGCSLRDRCCDRGRLQLRRRLGLAFPFLLAPFPGRFLRRAPLLLGGGTRCLLLLGRGTRCPLLGELLLGEFFPLDQFHLHLVQQVGWLTLDRDLDVVIALDLGQLVPLAVQQIVGDLERQPPHDLGDGPLGRGGVHLPQEGERHRLDRLDLAPAVTVRTLQGAGLVQGLADALPGHLQKAELGDAGDVDPGLVRLERRLHGLLDLGVVLSVAHVDEVDDDQPPQVAQPELPGSLLGSLHVGLEGGVLHPLLAGRLAGVDVDRHQRLGRLDEDGATRLERHLLLVDQVDLLLQLVAREDGALFLVHLDQLLELGIDLLQALAHVLVDVLAVHQHLVDVGAEIVADGPDDQGRLLVDEPRPLHGVPRAADPLVGGDQGVQILLELVAGPSHRLGPDDVAVPFGDGHLGDDLLELLALPLGLHLPGDPGGVAPRHQHHVAPRQRDVGGERGPLVVTLPLLDLDDQLLPPPEHLLDAGAPVPLLLGDVVAPLPVFRVQLTHLQEAQLLEPDVHESRLQPGLHPNHHPFVDVAPDLLVSGDLHIQIDQPPVLYDRHPRLFGVQRVNKHLLSHNYSFSFRFGAACRAPGPVSRMRLRAQCGCRPQAGRSASLICGPRQRGAPKIN